MNSELIKLSVIIVNYNTRELLCECLNSLVSELRDIKHEVIVVDNASTDGSQEIVKGNFSKFSLIENSENVGFPRANNQVLLTCCGEYIMLLNPDTVVLSGSIKNMFNFLDRNKEYGAVGPKLIRPDGTIQRDCTSSLPTLWKMFFELTLLSRVFHRSPIFGSWKMTYWDHLSSRDVECLLGAAIIMRRDILNVIGKLDEHMYIEDDDLCYRILKAGWKIRYLSTAEIVHVGSASLKISPKFYHHYQIAWHGLWYFFKKHKGLVQAEIFRLMTFVCSIIGLIFYFSASWFSFINKELSMSFRDKGKKACAVFLWSITHPKYFKAHY